MKYLWVIDTIIFIFIVRIFIKEYKERQFNIVTIEIILYSISVILVSFFNYNTAFLIAVLYFITCMSIENERFVKHESFLQDVKNLPVQVWKNQAEPINFRKKTCNLKSSIQVYPDTGTPHSGIIESDCLKDLARTRISSNNCCGNKNDPSKTPYFTNFMSDSPGDGFVKV